MAEFLHFSRDSRMYIVQNNRAWTVPVLDGFSFSQATNASEITLNEMEDASGRSRRGRKMFTDSLSAAEFSFSTYMRPFKAAGGTAYNSGVGRADSTANNHHAVEELLWVAMGSQNVYDPAAFKWKHGAAGGAIGGKFGGQLFFASAFYAGGVRLKIFNCPSNPASLCTACCPHSSDSTIFIKALIEGYSTIAQASQRFSTSPTTIPAIMLE